ncbi:hypothetical protein BV22DRAFT_1125187 [Leucogyrophana mollusca]|uniref:Uncharacterized protein n=1 Tax=Leucogyrophana mollusca TaxID=85980 RepID=A0ACB8BXP1_9AGAM|nr:hypothetical protein BV22DRAFT_1125187 [Leucogyrophana mollusca]
MLRDGTVAFFATMAIIIPTVVLLLVAHGAFALTLNPWFNAILSSAGCRLIINMQRLSLKSEGQIQTVPVLTSHIVIDVMEYS